MTREPRLMTKDEAAQYTRCSIRAFEDWVARGVLPKSVPGTHRWDRKAIDLALDKLGGLEKPDEASTPGTALDSWLSNRENASAT